MKKLLVEIAFISWAGTLYGAYAWGSWNKSSTYETELCSIGRETFQDSNKALDAMFSVGGGAGQVSLPLRAWQRTYSDSTSEVVMALVGEADFQLERNEYAGELIHKYCLNIEE